MLSELKPLRLAVLVRVLRFVVLGAGVWVLSCGGGSGAAITSPCSPEFAGNDMTRESPHSWALGETLVPAELVVLSSLIIPYCSAGFDLDGDQRDYDLAASFAFIGEGDDVEDVSVWWIFYPAWDDPKEPDWGIDLRKKAGDGRILYFDGYVVVISLDASDAIKHALQGVPDTDIWEAISSKELER